MQNKENTSSERKWSFLLVSKNFILVCCVATVVVWRGVTSEGYRRGVTSEGYRRGVTSEGCRQGVTSEGYRRGVTSEGCRQGVTSRCLPNPYPNPERIGANRIFKSLIYLIQTKMVMDHISKWKILVMLLDKPNGRNKISAVVIMQTLDLV